MKDINKRLEVLEETMAKMQEVIDDIRRETKEDPNKITVGDVVRAKNGNRLRFVVTFVDMVNARCYGITQDGEIMDALFAEVTKTGEHIYSVDEVLALMKEGEDDE